MEGRTDEAAAAVELLETGTPVGVLAEAGMGTTTLLDTIAAGFEPAARGGALRSVSSTPWLPLSRALSHDVARDPAGLVQLLEREVGTGVLVLDDLQWADPDTLAALPVIATTVRLLAGIRRGDAGESAARRALGAAGAVLVPLDPLEDRMVESLARRLRPDAPAAELARLAQDSGGNPGVLHQLVDLGAVGTTLAGALRDQVHRCDPPAVRALALLAENVDPLSPAVVGEHLDQLVGAGLVRVVDGSVTLRHQLVGEAATDLLDPVERAEVHRQLAALHDEPARRAEHLVAAGDATAALPFALDAAQHAGATRRPALFELAADCTEGRERADLLTHAAIAALDVRDHHAARRLAEASLAVPAIEPSTDTLAVAAEALALDGSPHDALETAARVPATADPDDRARAMAASALALAWPLWQPSASLERAAEACAIESDHPSARASLGIARLVAGDEAWRASADVVGPTALALGSLLDGTSENGTSEDGAAPGLSELTATVTALHRSGDCDGVGARLHELVDRTERATDLELARAHLSLALTDSGRTSAAAEVASNALRAAPSPAGHALLSWVLVEAETTAGRLTRARTAYAEMEHATPSPALALATVAAAWAAATAPAGAAPLPALSASPPWRGLGAVEVELDALALRCRGEHDAAEVAFTEAALGWARWHRRGELRCRWAAADAAVSGSHRATAVERLREVEQAAGRLGQRPLVARARGSLRAAGIRTRARRGEGRGPLSAREVEVLELVRLGFTSGEAAQALGVAASTVDTQVESAMRKLGARTRLHAAALVAELQT